MGIRITSSGTLENNLSNAAQEKEQSLERLSSGVRFTRSSPLPSERAQSEALRTQISEINSSIQSVQSGISLTEAVDSNLSELSNINIRMRELTLQSANESLDKKDRQLLFVEYQGLYKEMERIASQTDTNGDALLNYHSGSPTEIGIFIGSGHGNKSKESIIKIKDLDNIQASPKDLGLISAHKLIKYYDEDSKGISVDDVLDRFDADNASQLTKSFDKAANLINSYRATFGAINSRLQHTLSALEIAKENATAASSRIADVDYATEVSNLTKANILLNAGSSLLAQQQQQHSQNILTLIKNVER